MRFLYPMCQEWNQLRYLDLCVLVYHYSDRSVRFLGYHKPWYLDWQLKGFWNTWNKTPSNDTSKQKHPNLLHQNLQEFLQVVADAWMLGLMGYKLKWHPTVAFSSNFFSFSNRTFILRHQESIQFSSIKLGLFYDAQHSLCQALR